MDTNNDLLARNIVAPRPYAYWYVNQDALPELPFNVWFNAYSNKGHSPQLGRLFGKQWISVYVNPFSRYPTRFLVDPEEPEWRDRLVEVIQTSLTGQPIHVSVVNLRTNADWRSTSLADLIKNPYFRVIYPPEVAIPMSREPVRPPIEYTTDYVQIVQRWHDIIVEQVTQQVVFSLIGKSVSELKVLLANDSHVRQYVQAIVPMDEYAALALGNLKVEAGRNFARLMALAAMVYPNIDHVAIITGIVYSRIKTDVFEQQRQLLKEYKIAPGKLNVNSEPSKLKQDKRIMDWSAKLRQHTGSELAGKIKQLGGKSGIDKFQYVRAIVLRHNAVNKPASAPANLKVKEAPVATVKPGSAAEELRHTEDAFKILAEIQRPPYVGASAAEAEEIVESSDEEEGSDSESSEEETKPVDSAASSTAQLQVQAPPWNPPVTAETTTLPPLEPIKPAPESELPHMGESSSSESSGEEEEREESLTMSESEPSVSDEEESGEEAMPALAPIKFNVSEQPSTSVKTGFMPISTMPDEMPELRRINANMTIGAPALAPASALTTTVPSMTVNQPNVVMPSVVKNDLSTVEGSVGSSTFDTVYTGMPAADSGRMQVSASTTSNEAMNVGAHMMRPPPSALHKEKLKPTEKSKKKYGKKTKKGAPLLYTSFDARIKGAVDGKTMYVPTAQDAIEIIADRTVDDPVILTRRAENPNLKLHIFVPPLIPYDDKSQFTIQTMATYRAFAGWQDPKSDKVICIDKTQRSLANLKVVENKDMNAFVVYPSE